MNKLRQNLIISLEYENIPVRKVAVCYQKNRELAEKLASLLPYTSIVVCTTDTLLQDSQLDEISHVLELYHPSGSFYDVCLKQREMMRSKGCRILTLYDWEEKYLNDSFWGNTDYRELAKLVNKVKNDLAAVRNFHITSELGTDISFSVAGRQWLVADGICRNGRLTQMPDGEIYTCPVEESFSGVIVVDGTVSRSWVPDEPQHLEFRQGRLVNCSPALAKYIEPKGPDIYMIGEFALGLNPAHRQIVHNISVDEKAAGTVHFALGDSYNLGINHCKCHVDMVIRKPHIETSPRILLPYFS
ncbi:hypothetical protein P22_1892 [Propionispora sp. 2/2-37]|uniref:aminopeptidase n=1 Tax=Propionispora sp. 2/2-37 TaxID=1677858 RepID=UPI0006BB5646|nr:aminopeptidase [Propionispora sp. 2/2-37]CUH95812.1 hypothetical protein P22_1892 [Propionispora sp. 2/2-37]